MSDANEMLREWLRNERRLGVPHWPVPPAAPPAQSAPRAAPPPPAAPRPVPTPLVPLPAAPRPSAAPVLLTASPPRSDLPHLRGIPPLCDRELPPDRAAAALQALNDGWVANCRGCVLHQGRTQTVFGVGPARPDLVFVGEGPGADEDREGQPFVGKAGQLLNKMIAAMTLSREQVYICNVVKCRPPGNRTPQEDEIAACTPYLVRQLAILRPKVIVTLGAPAAHTLLQTKTPISRLRGRFHDFPPAPWADLGLGFAPLMPTFHPAYLLRAPWEKVKAWEDLQQVMKQLGLQLPSPRNN